MAVGAQGDLAQQRFRGSVPRDRCGARTPAAPALTAPYPGRCVMHSQAQIAHRTCTPWRKQASFRGGGTRPAGTGVCTARRCPKQVSSRASQLRFTHRRPTAGEPQSLVLASSAVPGHSYALRPPFHLMRRCTAEEVREGGSCMEVRQLLCGTACAALLSSSDPCVPRPSIALCEQNNTLIQANKVHYHT